MSNSNNSYPYKKSLRIGLGVFFSALLLTQFLAYQQYRISRDEESKKVFYELSSVRDRLKKTLSYSLSATNTLAFIIEKYGVPNDFDNVAKDILKSHKYIDALELTQKGLITHVYPLEGNKSALGFDVLRDPTVSLEAYKAIEKGELYFAGPLMLKQGGIAVIGRLPIHLHNEFFGFSVVIIKLSTLLHAIGIDDPQRNNFSYQLSKPNPLTHKEEFFLPDSINSTNEASASVEVPDGEWKLYVSNKPGTNVYYNVIGFSLLGLILSFVTSMFFYQWAAEPEKLNKLVLEKTSQLIDSQNNSRIMLERISDAFISFDRNLCYTYINKKAEEIFDLDPVEILGKNVWQQFPEFVKMPIYHAFSDAMLKQEYVCVELYFSQKERWLENHLYPSPNGLSLFVRDITEYKKAEEKLEASEKYFRALIENSTDAIVLLNNTGKVLYQSPSTEKISGYSLQEVQALDDLHLIHVDDRAEDSIMFAAIVQSPGKIFHRNHRLRHKNGSYIWIEGTYINLLDDTNVNAIVYNYHDVTERVQAEETIVREKHLSESIINSLPGIFYLYDRNRKFIRWNKNFEVVSGYSSKEISTMHPLDFYDDDEKKLMEQKIESVFNNKRDDVESFLYTRNKRKIPYYFNGRLTYFDGKEYLIGMGIDISERKHAEEKVLEVYKEQEITLNRISDAVISLDVEWRYKFLNDAALANHPLGREESIGKTFLEVHPEMASTLFWQMCQEAARTMKVMENESYYTPLALWLSVKAYPSPDGLTIFYKDITHRKKNEQETLLLISSLQAKNNDLQQFSYIVSHNLRAPIAKISGLTIIMGNDPEENKKFVQLIADEAASLDQVVRDINTIVSTRKTDREKHETIRFEKELDQIKQVLETEIAESGAVITYNFDDAREIESIKSYVYSILYNLITNAIKYRLPNIPLLIHLETRQDNEFICLSVNDNGRGIDLKKNKGKLFGLYKRFHPEEPIPGRGVGLTLVKTRAESLGGRVDVESDVNKGSTFKVLLPIRHGASTRE